MEDAREPMCDGDIWVQDPDEVYYTLTDIIDMGLLKGRE